ncbi:MAG: hypothetical protein HYY16_09415 [Planctomycetes bacterium]|nr:hypothetical protein [Planctomycetota bacterium]
MAEFVTKKEEQRRLATLIVCIILCTLSLVLGIYSIKGAADIQDKEKKVDTIKKLTVDIEERRKDVQILQDNYVDFSRPVGWRTDARASYDRFVTGGLKGEPLKGYLDLWVSELQRPGYNISEFKPWSGPEGAGDPLTLIKLYQKLSSLESDLRSKNQDLEKAIKKAEADAKATREEIEATEQKNLEEIDRSLKEEYKRLLLELSTRERQHFEELAGLKTETFALGQTLKDLRDHNRLERARLEQRQQDLLTRINWIIHHREEAKERKEPDGVVLAVDPEDNTAFIDLVHRDRIFKGTKFKVYSLEKGGTKVDKGEVEVIEVRPELSSRVAITSTTDPKDPIKPGDRIYNEFYEKGKVRYIAIAGRLSGKLSNEEAARLIREFGDVFQDKVDERTHYVVVGEGYENHPNYLLALEWGVKIMVERHLFDYLGVP